MDNEEKEEKKEHTSGKTLLELEQESLRKLEQFVVLTWQPNPIRQRVKVWIDDGTFKLVLTNEKFISTLENILMDNQSKKSYLNMRNIENSLSQYQGFYRYFRETDEFKVLHQLRFNDKMTKQELYENSRAEYNARFGKDNELNKIVDANNIFDMAYKADLHKEMRKSSYLQNVARYYGGF